MNVLTWFAHFISALGAMNWGLATFFKFDCIEYLTGMSKIDYLRESAYGLVALSGFYALISLFAG